MNRRRRMFSSNLCCRFETVPHCEKKRSTSPPEVGCVIKNSTLSWKGEGARDCHHSCKAVRPFISTALQRMYKLHCSAISRTSDRVPPDGGTRSNTHEMLSYIHQNHEKPNTPGGGGGGEGQSRKNAEKLRKIAINCGKLRTSIPPPALNMPQQR